ncbi:14964_t:CDS:2, partial [Dentiscutata erythropus]
LKIPNSNDDGTNFTINFAKEIGRPTKSDSSFLEFCKGRVALEVNDRKVLHKKYLEGLDTKIKETTTKNKKFTKNELKSIRDKLPRLSGYEDILT